MKAVTVTNWALIPFRAQAFSGPTSTQENRYMTVAAILREIADWVEREGVQDPEFESLIISTRFPSRNRDDWYQMATLYYRRPDDKDT